MRQLKIILTFLTLVSCGRESRDRLLKGLKSCDVDSICVSSYYFGEQRDKSVVRELLTGIKDVRLSHHIRHKGMSVYYCKATALNKISGLNISIQQTDKPDSVNIKKFIDWAVDNNLLDDTKSVELESCVSKID